MALLGYYILLFALSTEENRAIVEATPFSKVVPNNIDDALAEYDVINLHKFARLA